MKKLVFCFLLTNSFKFADIWSKFFKNENENKYTIISHIKTITPEMPKYITENAIKPIKTEWCGKSLIQAYVRMIKKGLRDPDNYYFILLSGACIPLYTFDIIYDRFMSFGHRSIMSIEILNKGQYNEHYYGEQWMALSRPVAIQFIDIRKQFRELSNKTAQYGHCPDELYPIYFFLERYNDKFNENILNKILTFTHWIDSSHPVTFNKNKDKQYLQKMFNKMCNSGALFARKFDDDIANEIAMKCSNVNKKTI